MLTFFLLSLCEKIINTETPLNYSLNILIKQRHKKEFWDLPYSK